MWITLISIVAANAIACWIGWDGRVVQSLLLMKWSILACILAIVGIFESKGDGSKWVKWYWISSILLTLLSFSKL